MQLLAAGSASPVLGIGLIALGGVLVGGAWTAREHSKLATVILGLFALVAIAAGVLWQLD